MLRSWYSQNCVKAIAGGSRINTVQFTTYLSIPGRLYERQAASQCRAPFCYWGLFH